MIKSKEVKSEFKVIPSLRHSVSVIMPELKCAVMAFIYSREDSSMHMIKTRFISEKPLSTTKATSDLTFSKKYRALPPVLSDPSKGRELPTTNRLYLPLLAVLVIS
jgi:hypothetical protein